MSDVDDVARGQIKDLQQQIVRLLAEIKRVENKVQAMINRSIHLGPRRQNDISDWES